MVSCSGGPFEFLTRPYPYPRQPFQLASGEKVTYEGIYFSLPGSGLLLDKRLYSHPEFGDVDVISTVKLYVNKDANIFAVIEPDDDGAIYTSGTPHYVDYIDDLRSLINDVTVLHARDTDYTATQFLQHHLSKVRATYDLTPYGILDSEYVHPLPTNTVPSGSTPPGASGALPPPGDGYELGARQITDVDMDELQWQVITRPKKQVKATPVDIPIEPIFPILLKSDGSLPSLNSIDETNLSLLAINGMTSGGILLTGDGLFEDTSYKLLSIPGEGQSASGSFLESIPWKLFPCQLELCKYYQPHIDPGATITALGRQSIYSVPPTVLDGEGVYLLSISASSDPSGTTVQHYPANYHATSGVDADGTAHDGVHLTDKLIFNLYGVQAGSVITAYSPINGKKVFLHWVGAEAGSKGEIFATASPKYQNGDTVYAAGDLVSANVGDDETSTQNWATTNNLFSPVTWNTLSTTALAPLGGFFTGTVWRLADIQAGADRGVISLKLYNPAGFLDRIVVTDSDRAQGGQLQSFLIQYHTIVYQEAGTDPETGEINWEIVDEFDTSEKGEFFDNTYTVNNIFSLFFYRSGRQNHGFVHVNGDVYFQWGEGADVPRRSRFAPIPEGNDELYPATDRSDVTIAVGVFPTWRLVRYVTTNNQVLIPADLLISPASSEILDFHPSLGYDKTNVFEFGPATWDSDKNVNYVFFRDLSGRNYFAEFGTDFIITRFNRVGDDDGFFSGRAALLSV